MQHDPQSTCVRWFQSSSWRGYCCYWWGRTSTVGTSHGAEPGPSTPSPACCRTSLQVCVLGLKRSPVAHGHVLYVPVLYLDVAICFQESCCLRYVWMGWRGRGLMRPGPPLPLWWWIPTTHSLSRPPSHSWRPSMSLWDQISSQVHPGHPLCSKVRW